MCPAWWTCPFDFDRMAANPDPRIVERDRDEHLRRNHAGEQVEPRLLRTSWWSTSDDPKTVRV